MASYNVPVIEVEGELALDFPDGLLEDMNWKAGDVLTWVKRNGTVWELSKKKVIESEQE